MTVHFLPDEDGSAEVKVAYAVGRKVGTAVVRNRCRRRLRAIAFELTPELAAGAYLVTVGAEGASLGFQELKERVSETMRTASRAGR